MRTKKIVLICALILLILPGIIWAAGTQEAKDQTVVLKWPTIWVGQDTKTAMVATLVDEFNEMYTGKYRVEIEANPDYDAYRNKLNSQIAAGIVPDLFVFNPDPTSFAFYEGENLLMDFSDELASGWGDDFVPGSVEEATINGETKTVPFEMAYTPIWYNMDILKKAGVTSIPTTYDEFFAAADKIKAAGYIPTSQMTGGTNAWTSMLWFSHIAASLGGPDVWQKDITDPVFVQSAEILKEMFLNGNTSKDAVGGDAGVSGGHYLAGRSAIFINGPWYIGRVKSDAPDVFAATKIGPAPGAAYHGAQIGFPLSNLAAAYTDDQKKKEAVVAFMKWMTKPENVKRISLDSGAMFAIKYSVAPEEKINQLQAQFINAVNDASFINPSFSMKYTSDVVAEFGQALAKMVLGKATPEEFVQQIADKIR